MRKGSEELRLAQAEWRRALFTGQRGAIGRFQIREGQSCCFLKKHSDFCMEVRGEDPLGVAVATFQTGDEENLNGVVAVERKVWLLVQFGV